VLGLEYGYEDEFGIPVVDPDGVPKLSDAGGGIDVCGG